MAKNSVAGLLTSVDDLFSTQESRDEAKLERVINLPPSEISDFPNHPFKVRMDEEMEQMAESVKEHGVLVPALVREKPGGGYRYEDTRMLGHGEESVILIQRWLHLTDKEVLAIRLHMGAYTGQQDCETLSKVYDSCPEALCVHMADMIATHIMEVGE